MRAAGKIRAYVIYSDQASNLWKIYDANAFALGRIFVTFFG